MIVVTMPPRKATPLILLAIRITLASFRCAVIAVVVVERYGFFVILAAISMQAHYLG